MTEDVSGAFRIGVTVVIVAALVAAALNLMSMSQSILSSGTSNLQSGVDQISLQEFENYNQKKISGTIVKSTIALYEGRDIACVVRTRACQESGAEAWAYNYGSKLAEVTQDKKPEGADAEQGTITIVKSDLTDKKYRKPGDSFYTCSLSVKNGIIETNNNTKGITAVGGKQFILESARFRAELIKDETGTIVGICFTQLI